MTSAAALFSPQQALEPWLNGVYAVAQTVPRVGAVFAVMPFLSGKMIPGVARNGLILTLAVFMAPASGPLLAEPNLTNWLLIAVKEALIGTMLGLGFGVLVWAVQSMGDLIDLQTGSGNAQFFDPVGGHEGGRTGDFLGWLVVTLFVTTGGMLALVGAITESFRIWPAATFAPRLDRVLELYVIRQGDTLLLWTVKLAAPVVFVLVMVDIGFGLLGRVAPQLNLFVFSQPVKSLLATLMLLLMLFYMYESLQTFLTPENGVLQFLRSAL